MGTETTQPSIDQTRSIPGWLKGQSFLRSGTLYCSALFTIGAAVVRFMSVQAQIPQSLFLTIALLVGGIIQVAGALAMIIFPVRRLLLTTLLINIIGILLWIFAHTTGLPIGLTLWKPEHLSIADLYMPIMEALGALLLLILLMKRPRIKAPKVWKTILAVLPALLLVNILTWWMGGSTWLGPNPVISEAWLPMSSTIHIPAGQTATVSYCQPNGSPLAMDISEPATSATRPTPMVFYIHGGEGITGFRQLELDSDSSYFINLRADLLQHGFVVGSIDYRLSPLYKTREQVNDAKCAVRFLRAHAHEIGIDPQRIGVYGTSQGGYLSSMLGTVGPKAGFDVGQYLDQSSSVQAVVDMWGYTDLTDFSGSPSWTQNMGALLNAGKTSKAGALAGSPINYVAAGDPPFLLIHGAEDWFIAPHHSQNMAKKLQAAGVPATLVMVQNDGHGLDEPTPGKVESPSPDTLVEMISNFFVKTLA